MKTTIPQSVCEEPGKGGVKVDGMSAKVAGTDETLANAVAVYMYIQYVCVLCTHVHTEVYRPLSEVESHE